ncbi:MD-2-related lipid-recognition protein-like [Danaus plexippus]|uniref:MD-2-related lipid-recognition protein-like n=1 Tax=Danaus plexippus TaxID=13037 RepID=UPI002AB2FA7E|nr:MD-2-related lipid-recognition protein-like [Danaus plexippus]
MVHLFVQKPLTEMAQKLFYLVVCIYLVSSEYVNRKSCNNVDPTKCKIHNVKLDPCPDGPKLCNIKREEPYSIAFDFTPEFDARSLKVALLSDPNNSTSFSRAVTQLHSGCDYTKCPIEKKTRNIIELDFEYYVKSEGKIPLQLRLWNDEDDSDMCCFIFDVNVLK